MFKLSSLSSHAREAVACSIAFERMGFNPSQIGAGVDSIGIAFVSLHHRGEQYNITFGNLVDISPDIFVGTWKDAIRNIQEKQVNETELAELCHRSAIWDKMEDVIQQLAKRGFLNV